VVAHSIAGVSTRMPTGNNRNSHCCPLPFHNRSSVGLPLVPEAARFTEEAADLWTVGRRWGDHTRAGAEGLRTCASRCLPGLIARLGEQFALVRTFLEAGDGKSLTAV
jgi:hypothetical protein